MIKNMQELQNKVDKYIQKALSETAHTIHEKLFEKVNAYYNEKVFEYEIEGIGTIMESEPTSYIRTHSLMESLSGGVIEKIGNSYTIKIGWDDDYLSMTYPGWKKTWGRGKGGVEPATGFQVLSMQFNGAMHGNPHFPGEHNYWDEALSELGGEKGITSLFIKNLKKAGLPIK